MSRQYSLQTNRAISILPPPPNIFPPEGPARCKHHLLLISERDIETGTSNACGFCNPEGNSDNGNVFVMPAFADHPLADSGRVYANNNAAAGECACGSRIHVVEARGNWRCADCGARIKIPKGFNAKTASEVEVVA